MLEATLSAAVFKQAPADSNLRTAWQLATYCRHLEIWVGVLVIIALLGSMEMLCFFLMKHLAESLNGSHKAGNGAGESQF